MPVPIDPSLLLSHVRNERPALAPITHSPGQCFTLVSRPFGLLIALAALAACTGESVVGGPDAGRIDVVHGVEVGAPDVVTVDASLRCASDQACDDRVYCNGAELCLPGHPRADLRGCVASSPATPCLGEQTCDETRATCISQCGGVNGDSDRDGHRAANCGGDDCDDADPNRYPGRTEVCDLTHHDEDCDPNTFGFRDSDMDSHPDGRCCNVEMGGVQHCGDDCNDSRPDMHPGLAESCDGADNDCNGSTDEGVLRTFHPDMDGDGFGSPAGATMQACFPPPNTSENATDCDDGHGDVHPGAPEVCDDGRVDENCDGVANPPSLCSCTGVGGRMCALPGVCAAGSEQCVNGRWTGCSIRPLAEVCNAIDDNCDGTVDEGLTVPCYADGDNDAYAAAGARITQSCPLPGREAVGGCPSNQTNRAPFGANVDCADDDPARRPFATEVCNGVDDNCDGVIDEGVLRAFFPDRDGDLFGDASSPTLRGCTTPPGYVENNTDCDDARASRNPAAPEACDGVDNNCNGMIDEGVQHSYHPDGDGDGYGNPTGATVAACIAPVGYVETASDCDDTRADVHPGAPEICDDAMVDESCDGVANPASLCSCTGTASRRCALPGVCAAGSEQCVTGRWAACSVRPLAEVCNRLDDNCDGTTDEGLTILCYVDADNDGYAALGARSVQSCPIAGREAVGGCPSNQTNRVPFGADVDCADDDSARRPYATEVCNGLDDNCDGVVDEGVLLNFYPDRDGDLFGDGTALPVRACAAPTGFAANNGDCDDARANRNPGAAEICDGVDNNCNGQIDEAGGYLVYRDADGDSWGDSTMSRSGCGSPPIGYAIRGGDCNDAEAAVFPGAPEACDNRDNDCNAATLYVGDLDRDGHDPLSCGGNDCNEADPTVYGTAVELCDRKDNNCSSGGVVDAAEDADLDLHAPTGNACVGGAYPKDDCDDRRAATYPGAVEACNGIDDNCNGVIDELPASAVACGFTNSVTTCASAACRLLSCVTPFLDCDRTDANGCEVDPRSNRLNCGGCGYNCVGAAGSVFCNGGVCAGCPAGFGDCDGNAANGCEVNLGTSNANCGACGRTCAPSNGSGACVAGACTVTACNAGYGDCDATASNGCESAFATSIANCGRCGTTCLVAANATPSCLTGVCGAGACASGYHLCGTQCFPNDSIFSCGTSCAACPGADNGTASCNGTTCAVRCLPGTGDCDGVLVNGCETTLAPGQQCCAGRACSGRCVAGGCLEPTELVVTWTVTCGLFSDRALRCLGFGGQFSRDDVQWATLSIIPASFYSIRSFAYSRLSDGAVVAQALYSSSQTNGIGSSGICAQDSVRDDSDYFAFQQSGDTRVYMQGNNRPGVDWSFGPFYSTGLRSDISGNFTELALAGTTLCGRDGGGNVVCSSGYRRTDGRVAAVTGGTGLPFCLRLTSGAVECIGTYPTATTVPAAVSGLRDATSLSYGRNHYCALRASGDVVCWGSNASGVLGDGTMTDSTVPVSASATLTQSARFVGAGYDHNCVIQADGTTRCWGAQGAWLGTVCDEPNTATRVAPASVAWPASAGLTLGADFACVANATGATQCMGANNQAQLGDTTTSTRTTFAPVSGLASGAAIVASPAGQSACAFLPDGTAQCWGLNTSGQLGDGTTTSPRISPRSVVTATSPLTGITQLALGPNHGCALLADGTVQCWGANASGQLGDGTTTARSTAAPVPGLTAVTALAAGTDFTCALRSDGTARCWGLNASGQLGLGTTTNATTASPVLLLDGAVGIAAGTSHACAVRSDGTARCWGLASSGQLGHGSAVLARWPVAVAGLTGATTVVAGGNSTCANTSAGWRCWGDNANGQLGVGDTTNRVVPAAVSAIPASSAVVLGTQRACAVATDGTVQCWGNNGSPKLWPDAATTVCSVNWGTT